MAVIVDRSTGLPKLLLTLRIEFLGITRVTCHLLFARYQRSRISIYLYVKHGLRTSKAPKRDFWLVGMTSTNSLPQPHTGMPTWYQTECMKRVVCTTPSTRMCHEQYAKAWLR